MAHDTAGELLEERQLLSATRVADPVAESQISGAASHTVARKAGQQTIDSPIGPINLTYRNHDTRIRGTAIVALTPGPTVPNVEISPIRFNGRMKNLQFTGRFSGSYAFAAFNGPTQQFKGTLNAGLDPLNPTNAKGHVTVTVEGNPVVDQDFNTPLSTLLTLLQQQQSA